LGVGKGVASERTKKKSPRRILVIFWGGQHLSPPEGINENRVLTAVKVEMEKVPGGGDGTGVQDCNGVRGGGGVQGKSKKRRQVGGYAKH